MARPILLKRDTYTHALEDGTVAIDTPFLNAHIESTAGTVPSPGTWPRPRPNTKFRKRQQHYEPPLHTFAGVPRMDIAILITGSRGDVQPFIALGKVLQAAPYHHRVRIGTHAVFRQFVCEHGLDFYSIGGDPARLMSYMVRNPGILPSMATIRAGEIGRRKADLEEMLMGTWRACTEISDCLHHADDDPNPDRDRPFVADCIISNPPTFGSLHIAERLSIPMHMMFTMPWSPTTAFPHPLARLNSAKQDAARLNYLSYMQIELMTWLGLVDIINRFRRHTLLLDPIDPARGTMLVSRLKVPHTYIWSPALIPKPPDWGEHISICGFSFLSLAPKYEPDAKLKAFLNAGERPIYIGFGSIVVEDPEAMSRLILEAVKKAGVRALVSKGWSNITGEVSSDVFLLGDVPHDWLFQHVSAVVHHGGAGTCAIGLALGKPTVIVPFFGDQFWWADMVSRSGAGPAPLPYKTLTADSLSEGIKRALEPDVQAKAEMLSTQIKAEDGAKVAAEQFHAMQHTERLRCFLCSDRVAVLRVRKTNIQLSLLAVAVLFKNRLLKPGDIKLVRHKRWYVEEGAPEPFTGMVAAAMDTMVAIGSDIQDCKRFVRHGSVHDEIGGWQSGTSASDLDKGVGNSPERDVKKTSPYILLAKRLAADAGVAPVNLFFNIANGFHNLPAYALNDDTVRERQRVTGIVSGLAVAGKEVVFGIYDSIFGLALHPYKGFVRGRGRTGGPLLGCAKGFGRSIGGMLCRSGSITFALPGYGLKGVEQQLLRLGDKPDRLSELSNHVLDAAWDRLAGAGTPDTRRRALREEWLSFTAGRPLMQRRVVQSFLDLEEMLETDPAQEGEILRGWEKLVQVKAAA